MELVLLYTKFRQVYNYGVRTINSLLRNKHKIKHMKCSKCDKRLSLFVKFCPKCGQAIPPQQRKRELLQLLIMFAVSLLCALAYVYYFYRKGGGAGNPQNTKTNIIIGIVASFFIFFAALTIVVGFVKFVIRRPIWGTVITILILSLAGGGYFIYWQQSSNKQFSASLVLIQDSLTEVSAAKFMGDAVIAKKTIPGFSMVRVQASAQLIVNRLEFMKIPAGLQDYQQAIMDWSNQIAVAAQLPEIWKDLPNQPRDFKLKLSDKRAENLLQDSAKKIAAIREFGDNAIKRKDKTTMLYNSR